MSSHRRYRRLIEDHFANDLTEAQQARLHQHLGQCAECRAEFDLAATMLRTAAGHSPTRAEDRRWEQALLSRLPPPRSIGAPRSARAGSRSRWLMWLAPAALAAGLLAGIGLWPRHGPPSPPEVQFRGAADGAIAPLVDIEVIAIDASRQPPAPRRLTAGSPVRLDEYLQLRYRNHSARVRYLFVLGLDRRLQALDYFPRPTENQSIAIQQSLGFTAIPRSIRVARRHRPGTLWVCAIFSEEPLSADQIHARVQELGTPDRLHELGLGQGTYVVVRQLQLTPGSP